eukprot:gene7484-2724_t
MRFSQTECDKCEQPRADYECVPKHAPPMSSRQARKQNIIEPPYCPFCGNRYENMNEVECEGCGKVRRMQRETFQPGLHQSAHYERDRSQTAPNTSRGARVTQKKGGWGNIASRYEQPTQCWKQYRQQRRKQRENLDYKKAKSQGAAQ